jgi:hypothetical protein
VSWDLHWEMKVLLSSATELMGVDQGSEMEGIGISRVSAGASEPVNWRLGRSSQ